MERHRQVSIRDQLELMAKKERVRRIRSDRSKSDLNMTYQSRVQSAPRGKSSQGARDDDSKTPSETSSIKNKVQTAKIQQGASKKVEQKNLSQVYHQVKNKFLIFTYICGRKYKFIIL